MEASDQLNSALLILTQTSLTMRMFKTGALLLNTTAHP